MNHPILTETAVTAEPPYSDGDTPKLNPTAGRNRPQGSVEGIIQQIEPDPGCHRFFLAEVLDGYPIACRDERGVLVSSRATIGSRVDVEGEIEYGAR